MSQLKKFHTVAIDDDDDVAGAVTAVDCLPLYFIVSPKAMQQRQQHQQLETEINRADCQPQF